MRTSGLAILLGAAAAAPIADSQNGWQATNPVDTSSGNVVGHEAKWPENAGVSEYLGIPFAEPPVGPLRWEKPVPFKGNGSTIQADSFVRIFPCWNCINPS